MYTICRHEHKRGMGKIGGLTASDEININKKKQADSPRYVDFIFKAYDLLQKITGPRK